MGTEGDRIRLVVMGDRKVGKTQILRQFLYSTFQEKYKATIEDLYSEDFNVGESKLKVDFLDTAGDDQFPVMRRLSISSGHAFLLVYSITDTASLELVQTRIEEIRQQRVDFKELPIVLVGNKVDRANEDREILIEDVIDWAAYTLPTSRIKVVECSAKDTYNINGVFKALLELSNIPHATTTNLRRGTSCNAKLRSNQCESKSLHSRMKSLKLPGRMSSEKRRPKSSQAVTTTTPTPFSLPCSPPCSLPSSPLTDCSSSSPTRHLSSPIFDFNIRLWKKNDKHIHEEPRKEKEEKEAKEVKPMTEEKKARSRSLSRRSSKKIRKNVREAKPDDCVIS